MMSPLPLGPVDFTAMATQEARSVSLAARLDLKLGGLASKKQTPLLYQLTSLVARRMTIACNCSDLPSPSPMPSRSPVPPTLSPSPLPVPAPPTTSGTAIASGNLANCRVGLDMSFTSRLGLSGWTESMDDVATVRTGASGAFQVPGVDGYLRVLPDSDAASWTSTSVTAAQTASGGSSPCYDSLTNKRLTLHLSAPGNYSVVSVTSTLVATLHAAHPAYSGASVQRVETDVKAALRLDLDLNLATANTYSHFTVQKDERFQALARKEAGLAVLVQSIATFLSAGSGSQALVQTQAFCMYTIAQRLVRSRVTSSRLLLQDEDELDFSNTASLTTLMASAAKAMTAAGSDALSSSASDPALIAAAVQALSNLQTVLAISAGDPQALAQALYLGQSQLLSSLSDLATGAVSVEDFATSTSTMAMIVAAAATPVPGQLVPNSCSASQQSMWQSACSAPNPFSCGPYTSDCVTAPEWDADANRLDFAYAWNLSSMLSTGWNHSTVSTTLYRFALPTPLPAGTYNLTLTLTTPTTNGTSVAAVVQLVSSGAPDLYLNASGVVVVEQAVDIVTVAVLLPVVEVAGNVAVALVYAGALLPVAVDACDEGQSLMVVSRCGLPDPRACGFNYTVCGDAPVSTNDMLAFTAAIPDAPLSLPPALYSSGVTLTLVNHTVNLTKAGAYRLSLIKATSVHITLLLSGPSGSATYNTSTPRLLLPSTGISRVSISITMPAGMVSETAAVQMSYVRPRPPPPAPRPPAPRPPLPPPPPPSVSAAFHLTLRVPVSYQQNEPSRAAAVDLLQRNMADNLDLSPEAVRISNVSFPLSRRALLAPTAAVAMHMLVTVTRLLLLDDVAVTTAQLNSLVYDVVLDPRRFINSSTLLQIGVNPADPILAEVVASPPSSLPPSPSPPLFAPRPSSSQPSPPSSLPTQAAPATTSSPSSRAKVLGPAIAIPIGLAVLAGRRELERLPSPIRLHAHETRICEMYAFNDRRRREAEAELMIMIAVAQLEEEEAEEEARPYDRICPYWKRPRSYKALYPNVLASLDPQVYNMEFHLPRYQNNEADWQATVLEFEHISGLPQIVGALDGSHIRIDQPDNVGHAYYNHKGFQSFVAQGLVNARGKFMDVYAGHPGHSAYATRQFVVSSFKTGIARDNAAKARFNTMHSKARVKVEHAWGWVKNKFQCCRLGIRTDVKVAVMVFMCCCILHNICIDHGEAVPEGVDPDAIQDYEARLAEDGAGVDPFPEEEQALGGRARPADLVQGERIREALVMLAEQR
ncbi:hypothetical protein QJQ45_005728 [Haematococcus lacustris]|nr:hypothetical protein QJQ45_005728 [Haematococcus lacustris]